MADFGPLYPSADQYHHVPFWHLWDMATGPDDVRFQGRTGSSRPTAKVTRLTRCGHQCALESEQ